MSSSRKTAARRSTAFVAYVAELHRAVHAVGLFLEDRLDMRLSQAEALVIIHLAALEPSTINDLHHAFLHRRSTLTSVLDRLEKKSLVRRIPVENDRRSVGIALTAGGRRVADKIASALGELQGKVETSYGLAEPDVSAVRGIAEAASDLIL